jgi:predicted nucleic acid-binding protein
MRAVLDSSVIVKWFKQEKDSEEALILREAYFEGVTEIAVPDLIFYEISNVMNYDDSIDTEEVKESIETLRDMDFEIVAPHTDLIDKAVELADRKNITVYDASFLALAELLDATLVTSDQELYRKTKDGNTEKLAAYVSRLDKKNSDH